MYLAQKKISGKTYYCIRESYQSGDVIKSRDLIDLGTRPDQYIIYSGGMPVIFMRMSMISSAKKALHRMMINWKKFSGRF